MAPVMLVTVVDLNPRELVHKTIEGMEENHLLTYASAMAFQVMTSLLPLALLGLSILGFLHLEDVYWSVGLD